MRILLMFKLAVQRLFSKVMIVILLLMINGCSAVSFYQCIKDPYCSMFREPIMKKIVECEDSKTGYDINAYLNQEASKKRVYDTFVAKTQYKETTRTYDDLRKECQDKYETEQDRLQEVKKRRKQEEQEKREKIFNESKTLALNSGFKGYAQFRNMHDFVSSAENGSIDINNYKDYVIEFSDNGDYAYKFSQQINDVEIYQPDYRYGLKLTVGIRRDKEQKSQPLEGQVIKNIKVVSFKGVETYTTILRFNKQILIFDRAINFRVSAFEEALKKVNKVLEQKKDKINDKNRQ